ncbi:uncharacterized protein [Littorina saxatilis]|uniref:VWFA domain-containing protein n=1 Tax=Littorina saxatilis TaxID=31220 RepID=A0AAN9GQL0_9CAEN
MSSAMLPNGPLQVVFSFDTTGSMSSALTEVRGRLSDMLQRLQTDLPAVTTAVVAHGDYCDERKPYLTKHLDFTDDLPRLVDFVNKVETTFGGDEPEAYEVMLRLVRRDLTWSAGSQRVLVVIGDAFPHPPNDKQNKDKIDWKEETRLLQKMGVRIYGVQVNNSDESTKFFRTITEITDGQHLNLSEFGTLCDVIMAICYREKGAEFLQNYEAEVRAREGRMALHKDLEGVFGVLRRADSSAAASATTTTDRPTKAVPLVKLTKAASLTKATSISKTGKKSKAVTAAKKLVARAARTTTAQSGSKRLTKPSTITRKLNREKVPETNFRFNRLCWSPWKLAVVPAEAEVSSGQWRRFLRGAARAQGGAVLGGVATGKRSQASVLCEAAVQTRPGARRYVVWCRVLPASSANRLSLSRLMASQSVRAQLERVMRSGCRLWVRWAKVSRRQDKDEVKQEVKGVYDYAWCHSNGCHRDVWVCNNGVASHRVQIAGALA